MDLRTSDEEAEIPALRNRIEELEIRRAELDRELLRRAYRIGELEDEINELEYSFTTSLSWRLTKPLRALKTLVGRLRRR